MAVYLLVAIRAVHDAEKLQRYRVQLDTLLARSGGRRIVTTDQVHVLEGDWHPARLAMYEFESMEQV